MTGRTAMGERMYRGLLRLYPSAFRDRYSDEMVQLFHDKLRDAHTGSASRGPVDAWLRMLGDVFVTAPSEHLRRNRDVAHSLTVAPSIQSRVLGASGIVTGAIILAALVITIPEPFFPLRIILFNLGSIAVIVAVHRRQSSGSPRLAALAAMPAVVANVWYALLIAMPTLGLDNLFAGSSGLVGFISGLALWSADALFGAITAVLGRVSRWGAAAVAIGSLLTLTGIDRLGLVSSTSPTIFNTLSVVGIVVVGVGWILMGRALATHRVTVRSA